MHRTLKHYFEPCDQLHEIKVGKYVADIYNDLGITEIQTRAFYLMRAKLEYFLSICNVTVVHPIPHNKWITWVDIETGTLSKRSKSPKRGSIYDVFHELYGIKFLLNHPNLSVCVMLIDMDEYRYLNGWSRDKKRGSTRCNRIPLALEKEFYINCKEDYLELLPTQLPLQFTATEFSRLTKLNRRHSWEAIEVLKYVGAIKKIGKNGNAIIYEKVSFNESET